MSDMQTIYQVKVASTNLFVEVDTSKIDDFNMGRVIQKGLDETIGKRGCTKLGKAEQHSSVEAWAEEKQVIAGEQRDAMYAGKFRWVGAKGAKKEQDTLRKEMLRLAWVTDGEALVRSHGHSVAKLKVADRARIAEAYVSKDPEKYRKLAEANIAAASVAAPVEIDLSFLPAESKLKPRGKAALKASTAPVKLHAVPPPAKAKPGAHLRQ